MKGTLFSGEGVGEGGVGRRRVESGVMEIGWDLRANPEVDVPVEACTAKNSASSFKNDVSHRKDEILLASPPPSLFSLVCMQM